MFARNGVTKFAGTAIVAGALGLAAFATAGTAGAMSSVDDTFLSEISAEGIAYESARARSPLRTTCASPSTTAPIPSTSAMSIMDETDLTTDQAAMFIVSSVGNYCPEYSVLFD